MPSLRLYRVIMPVDEVELATQFYSTLLDQPGMRVSPGRHYFRCGDVTLALYCPKADGDRREPRPNFDHIYLAVDNLEEVHGRAARLGGLSAATGDGQLPMGEIATRPWGERSFYMQDPFGNPLCFVDAQTLFTGRLDQLTDDDMLRDGTAQAAEAGTLGPSASIDTIELA